MMILINKIRYYFVSFVILFILSAQFSAGTLSHMHWAWPILSYPMYSQAKFEGDRLIHDYDVFGVLQDGDRIKVRREDLNMSYWVFRNTILKGIRSQNAELIDFLVKDLCSKNSNKLIRIEAQDLGVIITKKGPVSGQDPKVFASLDVSC